MTDSTSDTPEVPPEAVASRPAASTIAPHVQGRTEPHFADSQDSVVEYRSPSGWAMAALVLGLFSFVAMFGTMGWIVPGAAIVASTVALVRLRSGEAVTFGRPAALAGLCLGLVFISAGPAALWSAEWCLQEEAKQVAIEWFDYLRSGQPHKASQLGISPGLRQPLDDSLWAYYREHPESKRELEDFARQPLIRALLTLGPAAQVRYYETQNIERGAQRDELEQVYAVTYDDAGQKKTFFVRLSMDRTIDPATGEGRWRVGNAGGGIRPKSWSG